MSDYDHMLQPSGAGNYIQTLLWSMEFVIQVILEQDTIEVWNLTLKVKILQYPSLIFLKFWSFHLLYFPSY